MPIDDYSNDAPDAPPNNASAPAPGKFIKISVPDFMNTGSPSGMGSYLRLGAVEDLTKAGKASGSVGLILDLHGNPLTTDLNAVVNPTYDPYAPFGPTNPPPGPPATTPNQPPPAPTAPNNPSAAGPDPTGEDLASLVQGFADDTRNRGLPTGTPGGQPKDTGSTAQGPLYGYPWVTPVTDAKAPGQLDASPTGNVPPLKFTASSKPVFFPNDYRTLESSQLHTKGGWRDHSDGNRITTTRGDKVEVIRGNYKLVVLGRQDQTKPKLTGMDISGGVNSGDLSADASTDFNQGSTSFSTLSEWRQPATEANAAAQQAAMPGDIAALMAAAQAAQAKADAAALIAQQLQAAADAAAAAAKAAQKAAQSTEDVAAVAAANTAAQAAEQAAADAAQAQLVAQQALNAYNAAAIASKSAAATAAAADATAAAAQAAAAAAADQAAANPSPATQANAKAAAAASAAASAAAASADAAAASAAAEAAAKKTASDNAAAAAKVAKAKADAAAADAAAKATAAAQTATPGTLQAAIQAQATADNAQAQANNAATQASLAQAQADDARAKLLVVEAGLDATPLEKLQLWEDDGADPDYRSFSTSKGGSGPKVLVKYQECPNNPAVDMAPDGVTYGQPISMGVSIAEKWSYQVYNYQGIGYYPLTIPQPQPYPPPKTQVMSKDGKTPIDAPARVPPPPDFPTLPEWQIYPISKVVNKTYTWRQSSETYIEQTVSVTAGPRLHPAVTNPETPGRTYPPDAFGARLYNRDLLKAVLLPGARPGAYNRIGSTWSETHVHDQKNWVRADDTLSDTEVIGLQHTVSNINQSLTQSHTGKKTDETTVGSQSSTSMIGTSTSMSLTGMKSTLDVTGLSNSISITGVKSAVTITGVDIAVQMTGLKITATFGPLKTIEIPTKESTGGAEKKQSMSQDQTTAGTNSHTAAAHKFQ